MKLTMNLNENSYPIIIEKNGLLNADKYFNLQRKVLIITDENVPVTYAYTIKEKCKEGYVVTLPSGEGTKSFTHLQMLLKIMTEKAFTRKDAVVSVGGGVIGDLGGFCASMYMRGVDFYNVPTTTLSQIDSSIGGKCAINFEGIKNIIGAFYQPKAVIVDVELIKSLDQRQISSGLVEAVKMAATFDEQLFSVFENEDIYENMEKIILRSLVLKKHVVEQDEKESGLRKVLNFGHTIGHGIEAYSNGKYTHGECVGTGMLYMCDDEVRTRIQNVLERLCIPVISDFDKDKVRSLVSLDKKATTGGISGVWVNKIGEFEFKLIKTDDIKKILEEG